MKLAVSILGRRDNPHLAAFEPAFLSLTYALSQLGHSVDPRRDHAPSDWSRYERVFTLGAIHAAAVGFELPANAVVCNHEQAGSGWFDTAYKALLQRLPWWDYNVVNATEVGRDLPRAAAVVPVADTVPSCLAELHRRAAINHEDYPVDVAFVGWMNERRRQVVEEMRHLGLRVEVVDGAGGSDDYGPRRRAVLTRCKLAVNVHFYPAAIFESSRAAYLLANGVPLLTEYSRGVDEWAALSAAFAQFEDLPQDALRLVQDPAELTAMADCGRASLAEYAPKYLEQVRAALAKLPPVA